LSDINIDHQEILKQKNEFDVFRVANTFQKVKFNHVLFKSDDEGSFFRGVLCQNCEEVWEGICDANRYCNHVDDGAGQDETITDSDDHGICDLKQQRYSAFSEGILSQTVAESLFDVSLHRRLRDNLMKNYNVGEKYIEYYYAISGFLQRQDYSPATLLKLISTLPDFNDSIKKLVDQTNNGNEVIITESLRNDMFAIIADLQNVSDNEDYQFILNDLKNDLDAIKNKTKDQLLNELH
jgi:hypothetical protein